MKLLPHAFKWIGLAVFLLGFIFGAIDDGRQGFMEGYNETVNEPVEYNFKPILPERISHFADYATLLGLLIYILSKNKIEDEFAQKMRFESAFIVFILTISVVLVWHIFNPEFELSPSTFLAMQMFAYLIIRSVKRGIILGENYEK